MTRSRDRRSVAARLWIDAAKLAAVSVLAGLAVGVLLILLFGGRVTGEEAPLGVAPRPREAGGGRAGDAGGTSADGAAPCAEGVHPRALADTPACGSGGEALPDGVREGP